MLFREKLQFISVEYEIEIKTYTGKCLLKQSINVDSKQIATDE